ncbi:MAG: alpha/beta fold hydrolase [Nevskiales bacterium]
MTDPKLGAAAEWQAGGHSYSCWDNDIFYRDDGEGDAVLCLHGFPTSSWDWRKLWPELTRNYRAIAPDMIGLGFSAKPFHYHYGIFDYADLCEDLLLHLGVNRVHLLAHNFGATVTQELLARLQERQRYGENGLEIRSVCFLNSGIVPEASELRVELRLLLEQKGRDFARLFNEAGFAQSLMVLFGRDNRPSAEELASYWQLGTMNGGLRIADKLVHFIADRRKHRGRWLNATREAQIPVSHFNGTQDPVCGLNMVAKVRELLPNVRIELCDRSGHFPHLETPQELWSYYRAFLAALSPR